MHCNSIFALYSRHINEGHHEAVIGQSFLESASAYGARLAAEERCDQPAQLVMGNNGNEVVPAAEAVATIAEGSPGHSYTHQTLATQTDSPPRRQSPHLDVGQANQNPVVGPQPVHTVLEPAYSHTVGPDTVGTLATLPDLPLPPNKVELRRNVDQFATYNLAPGSNTIQYDESPVIGRSNRNGASPSQHVSPLFSPPASLILHVESPGGPTTHHDPSLLYDVAAMAELTSPTASPDIHNALVAAAQKSNVNRSVCSTCGYHSDLALSQFEFPQVAAAALHPEQSFAAEPGRVSMCSTCGYHSDLSFIQPHSPADCIAAPPAYLHKGEQDIDAPEFTRQASKATSASQTFDDSEPHFDPYTEALVRRELEEQEMLAAQEHPLAAVQPPVAFVNFRENQLQEQAASCEVVVDIPLEKVSVARPLQVGGVPIPVINQAFTVVNEDYAGNAAETFADRHKQPAASNWKTAGPRAPRLEATLDKEFDSFSAECDAETFAARSKGFAPAGKYITKASVAPSIIATHVGQKRPVDAERNGGDNAHKGKKQRVKVKIEGWGGDLTQTSLSESASSPSASCSALSKSKSDDMTWQAKAAAIKQDMSEWVVDTVLSRAERLKKQLAHAKSQSGLVLSKSSLQTSASSAVSSPASSLPKLPEWTPRSAVTDDGSVSPILGIPNKTRTKSDAMSTAGSPIIRSERCPQGTRAASHYDRRC